MKPNRPSPAQLSLISPTYLPHRLVNVKLVSLYITLDTGMIATQVMVVPLPCEEGRAFEYARTSSDEGLPPPPPPLFFFFFYPNKIVKLTHDYYVKFGFWFFKFLHIIRTQTLII